MLMGFIILSMGTPTSSTMGITTLSMGTAMLSTMAMAIALPLVIILLSEVAMLLLELLKL
jgi:hypothetical protein